MKFNCRYMQEGGAVPAEQAPAQGGAEDQMMQLAQQLAQSLLEQVGDPQAALAVLQAAAEMIQQAAGAGAPAEPTFQKKGGVIMRCGGKAKKASK